MFEKEAEEYATKKVGDFKPLQEDKETEWVSCCEDFQKGAEFGYNKARKELGTLGFIDGYNKANEWHFVKDGDLPKHEVNVLVLYNVQCINIAHYNYDYKEWHFDDSIVCDVIAWKEIVLPKLPKESE